MASLVKTPFKLTHSEMLLSAAATLCLLKLTELGAEERPVGNICEPPQYGFTASASWEPCGPRFVRITDVQAGELTWTTVPYCECASPENYFLAPGDILVARSGSTGKTFLVGQVPEPAVFASYMIRLRAKPAVLPAYLYWCFQSQQFWEQIVPVRRGSAMGNINGKMLSELRFPVPDLVTQDAAVCFLSAFRKRLRGEIVTLPALPGPLDEQRRIVARIEALAARIEQARGLRREAMEETEALLDAARAAVFQRALARSSLSLSAAATLERGRFSHRPRNDPMFYGGVHPWIQIGEIEASGKYIRLWTETLNDEGLAVSRKFPKGTLLISIAATIGAVGILDFDCCVPDSVVAVTPRAGGDSVFLYHYLGYLRRHLEQVAPQSAQKNINLEILASLPVPDLSLQEQQCIAAHLDSVETGVNELKQHQQAAAEELDTLLPSVLDRAFRGEL